MSLFFKIDFKYNGTVWPLELGGGFTSGDHGLDTLLKMTVSQKLIEKMAELFPHQPRYVTTSLGTVMEENTISIRINPLKDKITYIPRNELLKTQLPDRSSLIVFGNYKFPERAAVQLRTHQPDASIVNGHDALPILFADKAFFHWIQMNKLKNSNCLPSVLLDLSRPVEENLSKISHLQSTQYVLKPSRGACGNGIIIIPSKDELIAILKTLKSFHDGSESFDSDDESETEIPQSWFNESDPYGLLQELVHSEPVGKEGKTFDPTGRAFIFSYLDKNGHFKTKIIALGWILPRESASSSASLNHRLISHIVRGDNSSFLEMSAEHQEGAKPQLKKFFHDISALLFTTSMEEMLKEIVSSSDAAFRGYTELHITQNPYYYLHLSQDSFKALHDNSDAAYFSRVKRDLKSLIVGIVQQVQVLLKAVEKETDKKTKTEEMGKARLHIMDGLRLVKYLPEIKQDKYLIHLHSGLVNIFMLNSQYEPALRYCKLLLKNSIENPEVREWIGDCMRTCLQRLLKKAKG